MPIWDPFRKLNRESDYLRLWHAKSLQSGNTWCCLIATTMCRMMSRCHLPVKLMGGGTLTSRAYLAILSQLCASSGFTKDKASPSQYSGAGRYVRCNGILVADFACKSPYRSRHYSIPFHIHATCRHNCAAGAPEYTCSTGTCIGHLGQSPLLGTCRSLMPWLSHGSTARCTYIFRTRSRS